MDFPFKVKINEMEYGYYLIEIYFNMYTSGAMTEECFNGLKDQLLKCNANETQYKNLEGREWVRYFSQAFDELFTLFKIGAITEVEFEEHYKLLKSADE